jgi:hypothetical protein
VAGDPANVRAPDRDVEGSPATTEPPAGGVARPTRRRRERHNSITWIIPLFIEWSAAPVTVVA